MHIAKVMIFSKDSKVIDLEVKKNIPFRISIPDKKLMNNFFPGMSKAFRKNSSHT